MSLFLIVFSKILADRIEFGYPLLVDQATFSTAGGLVQSITYPSSKYNYETNLSNGEGLFLLRIQKTGTKSLIHNLVSGDLLGKLCRDSMRQTWTGAEPQECFRRFSFEGLNARCFLEHHCDFRTIVSIAESLKPTFPQPAYRRIAYNRSRSPKYVVMLRNPIRRVLSEIRHACGVGSWDYNQSEFMSRNTNNGTIKCSSKGIAMDFFNDSAHHIGMRNRQARMISGLEIPFNRNEINPNSALFARFRDQADEEDRLCGSGQLSGGVLARTALNNIDQMDAVLVTELFTLSIHVFNRIFGFPVPRLYRVIKQQVEEAYPTISLDKDESWYKEIRRKNGADVIVYLAALDRLCANALHLGIQVSLLDVRALRKILFHDFEQQLTVVRCPFAHKLLQLHENTTTTLYRCIKPATNNRSAYHNVPTSRKPANIHLSRHTSTANRPRYPKQMETPKKLEQVPGPSTYLFKTCVLNTHN